MKFFTRSLAATTALTLSLTAAHADGNEAILAQDGNDNAGIIQ